MCEDVPSRVMRFIRSLRMLGSIISTSASVELLSCLTFTFRIAAYNNNTVGQRTSVPLLVPADPTRYCALGVTEPSLVLQLGHANRATGRYR
jgi:hypothetical protein